jgi:hypothetical protein
MHRLLENKVVVVTGAGDRAIIGKRYFVLDSDVKLCYRPCGCFVL